MFRYSVLTLVVFLPIITAAQSTIDYAVQVTATVQTSPPTITLHWPYVSNADEYNVYRKAKENMTSWGSVIATLTPTDTMYADTDVALDTAYEYRVVKTFSGASYGYGYIYAGIKSPPTHWRGKLLLIVDDYFADTLSFELQRLMSDIRGNGWAVERYDISRNDLVTDIKSIITTAYNADSEVQAVLLVGHVPVPYSGLMYPDGHTDHYGAWPADVFYGEIDGIWTDISANDSSASRPENHNVIGDGKYDQYSLPSNVELQVSRIDVFNMPAFATTETIMMRRYLDKDHAYRQKQYIPIHRALIDDNFGAFGGEAFASNGYRNFPPLVNTDSVYDLDFISTLNASSYQWAYGCGGGWYSGSGGIGSTTDFVNDSVKAIFTMLFGSYFGDWDSQDNFLRAPLCASEPALTCSWSGRPHWYYYHMGLGENIGYSTRLSHNSPYGLYYANYGQRYTHVALMGDLTLEQNVVAPPSDLLITQIIGDGHSSLSWTASTDTVLGYFVYRSTNPFGKYDRVSDMLSATNFIDSVGTTDVYHYMVRAAKMEMTPSGSYVNLSEGIVDSAQVFTVLTQVDDFEIALYPNPASQNVLLTIPSERLGGTWNITDVTGKILLSGTATTLQQTINVSKLIPGFYQLHYNSNNFTYTKKLTVIR